MVSVLPGPCLRGLAFRKTKPNGLMKPSGTPSNKRNKVFPQDLISLGRDDVIQTSAVFFIASLVPLIELK